MPPRVPRPESRRGAAHATQERDRTHGRFTERFLEFSFGPIAPFASQTVKLQVQSMGSRFIRVLALRATLLKSTQVLHGTELANLLLRFQAGASEDMIVTGQGDPTNACSFAMFSAGDPDPWFYFLSPPMMRAGDTFQATVSNGGFLEGGAAPTLTPELTLKVMDDKLYTRLYVDQLAEEMAMEGSA